VEGDLEEGTVQLVRDGLSEHDIWQGLQAFQVRNHESFMYQGLTALSRFKQTVPLPLRVQTGVNC
jgi:hypothetical protein